MNDNFDYDYYDALIKEAGDLAYKTGRLPVVEMLNHFHAELNKKRTNQVPSWLRE